MKQRHLGYFSAAAAIGFLACAPIQEGIRGPAPPAVSAGVQSEPHAGSGTTAQAGAQVYNPLTDPLAADARITGLASAITHAVPGTAARLQLLFDMLGVGGREGVRLDMGEHPPRTAAETIGAGGDCSDLANLAGSVILEMNRNGAGIEAGAMIVHFTGAPQGIYHMIVFAKTDDQQVLIDLAARRLGETLAGGYETTRVYRTLDEATAAYHREYGDFLLAKGDNPGAISAYSRSLEIFSQDGYVFRNLGVAYSRVGDYSASLSNHMRAHDLEPSLYSQEEWIMVSVDAQSQLASQAFGEGRWADAIGLYNRILEGLRRLPPSDARDDNIRRAERNIAACQANAVAAEGQK
jgi:hypothetical protein